MDDRERRTWSGALQAAATACRREGAAVLPPALVDWFFSCCGNAAQTSPRAADVLPQGWPVSGQGAAAVAAVDDLGFATLGALLDAQALDRRALTKVHAAVLEARDAVLQRIQPATSQTVAQALQARDRQLSIATHELRTPIATILLNLELLHRATQESRTLASDTVARMLTVPSRQLRRLMHMVDLLLDSAQVESDRLVLDAQQVDLCELVRDVVSRLQEMAKASGVQMDIDACQPIVGQWDRLRLEQVAHNLLTNAIKYGGGHVSVVVRMAQGEAVLEVRDRGSGIAPEDRAQIFEPFKRLPTAATEDGAGLGLYIVREIVLAHGGRVEVCSDSGKGSTFRIHLPQNPTGGPDQHGTPAKDS